MGHQLPTFVPDAAFIREQQGLPSVTGVPPCRPTLAVGEDRVALDELFDGPVPAEGSRPRRGGSFGLRAPASVVSKSGSDLNSPWHRLCALCDGDCQHAILPGGLDVVAVYCVRQNEAAMETADAALGTTELRFVTALV